MTTSRVVVALDYAEAGPALALARRLDPGRCRLKVGKELFVAEGPGVVSALQDLGFEIFLDLKFHDIPNTVAGACRAAARLGVWMVNVHASGGRSMLEAAREALDAGARRPLLIGVTLLTSMTAEDLAALGMDAGVDTTVGRLATLCAECRLDGVVCSAGDLPSLRASLPAGFLTVTPGIRPAGASHGDQRRVATPASALGAGASYLVIGRPVTRAPDPLAALDAIEAEIAGASGLSPAP